MQLFTFQPVNGQQYSPFCLKVEIYCQLAKLDYTSNYTLPFKGPRGKLPYAQEGETTITDSQNIIAHLKQKHGDPLDTTLSATQHAIGHGIQQVVEQSLYFALLYSRWQDDRYWPQLRDAFFASIPAPARKPAAGMVRKGILKALRGQGYGRLPEDELYNIAKRDLDFLAQHFEHNPFAAGDSISSYDASVYALLSNLIDVKIGTPIEQYAQSLPALNTYTRVLKQALKQG